MLDMAEIRVCSVVDIDVPGWSACRDAHRSRVPELGKARLKSVLQAG